MICCQYVNEHRNYNATMMTRQGVQQLLGSKLTHGNDEESSGLPKYASRV